MRTISIGLAGTKISSCTGWGELKGRRMGTNDLKNTHNSRCQCNIGVCRLDAISVYTMTFPFRCTASIFT